MKKWIIGLIGALLLPCVVNAEETTSRIVCPSNTITEGETITCSVRSTVYKSGLYVSVEIQLESGEKLTISNIQNGTLGNSLIWRNPASDYENNKIVNDIENMIYDTDFEVATFKITADEVDADTPSSVSISSYTINTGEDNYENEHEFTGSDTYDITVTNKVIVLDNNNDLSYLKVSAVGKDSKISQSDFVLPEFTYYVDNDVTQIKIEGTAASTAATITGLGTFDLNAEDDSTTTFEVTVTAENGDIQKYTIHVTKKEEAPPAEEQETDIKEEGEKEAAKQNNTSTVTPSKDTKVKNPKTSVAIPIVLILVLGTIAGVTYYYKRKDRFMKF